MDAYKRFHNLLKRDFFPVLRAEGFKGSGTTLRRMKGDRIDVIVVQGSRYGGQCCVNLAVHYSFLPSMGGGRVTDPNEFKEYDCAFRDRLKEEREDHWWKYGETESESMANAADLVDLYQRKGTRYFSKFEPFPEIFEKVTPQQIDSGDLTGLPFSFTRVLTAITMARIMKHLGHTGKCREFAAVGLRHLGKASSLKAELESLGNA